MSYPGRGFARAAMWALPIWAAMLFLGTLTHQPDPQTAFGDFAEYVSTSQFLWSHLVNSILGAAIGSIGVVGLAIYLLYTRAAGKGLAGMAATVAGNTLNASVFGAAAFAQPAMGRMYLAGEQNAVEFYNQTYAAPLFGTAALSLLLFIAGGILTGIAITTSGRFSRWAGWVYALAVLGFALSVFLLPVGQTVTSALLFIATVVVAWRASRAGSPRRDEALVSPKV